jgi:hypothetical protein
MIERWVLPIVIFLSISPSPGFLRRVSNARRERIAIPNDVQTQNRVVSLMLTIKQRMCFRGLTHRGKIHCCSTFNKPLRIGGIDRIRETGQAPVSNLNNRICVPWGLGVCVISKENLDKPVLASFPSETEAGSNSEIMAGNCLPSLDPELLAT